MTTHHFHTHPAKVCTQCGSAHDNDLRVCLPCQEGLEAFADALDAPAGNKVLATLAEVR